MHTLIEAGDMKLEYVLNNPNNDRLKLVMNAGAQFKPTDCNHNVSGLQLFCVKTWAFEKTESS